MFTAPVAFTIPANGTLSLLDGCWLVTSFGDPDDDLLAGLDGGVALELVRPDDDDAACSDVRIVPAARR